MTRSIPGMVNVNHRTVVDRIQSNEYFDAGQLCRLVSLGDVDTAERVLRWLSEDEMEDYESNIPRLLTLSPEVQAQVGCFMGWLVVHVSHQSLKVSLETLIDRLANAVKRRPSLPGTMFAAVLRTIAHHRASNHVQSLQQQGSMEASRLHTVQGEGNEGVQDGVSDVTVVQHKTPLHQWIAGGCKSPIPFLALSMLTNIDSQDSTDVLAAFQNCSDNDIAQLVCMELTEEMASMIDWQSFVRKYVIYPHLADPKCTGSAIMVSAVEGIVQANPQAFCIDVLEPLLSCTRDLAPGQERIVLHVCRSLDQATCRVLAELISQSVVEIPSCSQCRVMLKLLPGPSSTSDTEQAMLLANMISECWRYQCHREQRVQPRSSLPGHVKTALLPVTAGPHCNAVCDLVQRILPCDDILLCNVETLINFVSMLPSGIRQKSLLRQLEGRRARMPP